MNVTMIVYTGYGGKSIKPGDTVDAPETLCSFWIKNGIAVLPKVKKTVKTVKKLKKEAVNDGADSGNRQLCDPSGSDGICCGELCDNVSAIDSVDGLNE